MQHDFGSNSTVVPRKRELVIENGAREEFSRPLPNGDSVRYGLSSFQSQKFPGRQLWYLQINLGLTLIVEVGVLSYLDEICLMPNYFEILRLMSWANIGTLEAYTNSPGYVINLETADVNRKEPVKYLDILKEARDKNTPKVSQREKIAFYWGIIMDWLKSKF